MAKEIIVEGTHNQLVEDLYDKLIKDFQAIGIAEENCKKMVLEIDSDCTEVFMKIPYKLSSTAADSEYLYLKGKVINTEDYGLGIREYKISLKINHIDDHRIVIEKRTDDYLYELIKFFGLPSYYDNKKEFNRIEEGKFINYYRSTNSICADYEIDIKEKFSD